MLVRHDIARGHDEIHLTGGSQPSSHLLSLGSTQDIHCLVVHPNIPSSSCCLSETCTSCDIPSSRSELLRLLVHHEATFPQLKELLATQSLTARANSPSKSHGPPPHSRGDPHAPPQSPTKGVARGEGSHGPPATSLLLKVSEHPWVVWNLKLKPTPPRDLSRSLSQTAITAVFSSSLHN